MIPIDAFKRRLAKLIETSNEMALGASDSQFVRGPDVNGEVCYVFDEPALEAFVLPDEQRRKYSAYFHLRDWRDEGDDTQEFWILINEMISILAVEFMLLGKLPGQVSSGPIAHDRIYMTYWHQKELNLSAEAIQKEIAADVKQNARQRMRERRAALADLEWALQASVPTDDGIDKALVAQDSSDVRFQSDMLSVASTLRGSTDISADEVRNELRCFVRARRLARVFAQHKEVFRADQLRRLAQKIVPRLRSLDDRFAITPADDAMVEQDANMWHELLSAGLEQRSERSKSKALRAGARPRRAAGSSGLKRDALSIAQVQHIARRKLRPWERIVLVTGDRLMLETYWNWYADRYVKEPREPNIIRSVGRFSPIMNFSDMLKPGGEYRAPFELMQIALELAIDQFNMSAHQTLDKEDRQKVANLWYLRHVIVGSIDNPDALANVYFPQAMRKRVEPQFRKVRDKCQEIERNSFRVGLQFLEQRGQDILRYELQSRPPPDEETQVSAIEYFRDRLAGVVVDSVRLSLSLVQSTLRQDARTSAGPLRPPLTLRLMVPATDTAPAETILDFEQKLREKAAVSDEDITRFERAPHLLFVLASLFALRKGVWAEALRNAQLAKAAYRHIVFQDEHEARQQGEYFELRYLHAVSARLMIGNVDPRRAREGDSDQFNIENAGDVWYNFLSVATENLSQCIEYHQQNNQPLRALRALSEGACARFFYAAWASFVPETSYSSYNRKTSVSQFRRATSDLSRAFDQSQTLTHIHQAIDEQDGMFERAAMLDRVRRQIHVNIAAADSLWRRSRIFQDTPKLGSLVERSKDIVGRWIEGDIGAEVPQLVALEMATFARQHGFKMPVLKVADRGPPLALDRALIQLLRSPTDTKR